MTETRSSMVTNIRSSRGIIRASSEARHMAVNFAKLRELRKRG
jgi:hypothetical protein